MSLLKHLQVCSDDLICAICGEPWNAHGVRPDGKGDMESWEAKLFLKGAGCPSCGGEEPEGLSQEDRDELFELFGGFLVTHGYDDFGHYDAVAELPTSPPEWKKPEPTLLKTCGDCGAELWRDADGDVFAKTERRVPHCNIDEQEEWRDFRFAGKASEVRCPQCWVECAVCDEAYMLQTDDVYDHGGVLVNGYGGVCIGCYEDDFVVCAECGTEEHSADMTGEVHDNDYYCEDCLPEAEEADDKCD